MKIEEDNNFGPNSTLFIDKKFTSVADCEVVKQKAKPFLDGKRKLSESDLNNLKQLLTRAIKFCSEVVNLETNEETKEDIRNEINELESISSKLDGIWDGTMEAEPEYEGNGAFLRASMFGLDPENRWFDEDSKGRKSFSHVKCGNDILEHELKNKIFTEYDSGIIHPFVSEMYLKDGEPFFKSLIQYNADVDPQQIAKVIEYIKNRTRIVDPAKIRKTMEEVMPLPEGLIPLENGLFDVQKKLLNPHSPLYYYLSHIPRKYKQGGKSGTFRRLLEIMFTGDPEKEKKIIQIYEIIAWTLTPGYIPQGSATLIGSGGEGKSIVITIIKLLLGKDNVSSVSVQDIESDKFKRPELYGKFANITSEAGGIIKSEIFKRATDYSDITADRKNGGNFTFNSRAKWIMATNKLPETKDNMRAFHRRTPVFIVFENYLEELLSPVEIDRFVKTLENPKELDLIFSEVVDDYLLPFMERKKFTGQLTIEESQKQYDRHSNPSQAYIQERANNGEIVEEIEEAKEIAKKKGIDIDLIFKVDKQNGNEQLLTIKSFIEKDARQWAKKNNLQADLINVSKLGKALETVGFRNITCEKKIEKMPLRAWLGLFIVPVDSKVMSKSGRDKEPTSNADNKGSKTLEDYPPDQKDNNNGMLDNNTLKEQVALSENGVLPSDPLNITSQSMGSSTSFTMLPDIGENKNLDIERLGKESATYSDINQEITDSNLVTHSFSKLLPNDTKTDKVVSQISQIKGNMDALEDNKKGKITFDLNQSYAIKGAIMEAAFSISNGKKGMWIKPFDILKNIQFSIVDGVESLKLLNERILPSMAAEGLISMSNGMVALTGRKLNEADKKEPDNQEVKEDIEYVLISAMEDIPPLAWKDKDYYIHKGDICHVPKDVVTTLIRQKRKIRIIEQNEKENDPAKLSVLKRDDQ